MHTCINHPPPLLIFLAYPLYFPLLLAAISHTHLFLACLVLQLLHYATEMDQTLYGLLSCVVLIKVVGWKNVEVDTENLLSDLGGQRTGWVLEVSHSLTQLPMRNM